MAKTREIKKRMGAVKTIQRITRTMQMIATAKFTAAVARTNASKPYTEKIRQLVGEVTAAAGEIDDPMINGHGQPVGRELLFVITSDRGLCGAYNAHVLRKSMEKIRAFRQNGTEFDLETSGKKAVGYFRFQKVPIKERHTFGDKPQYEEVERLAQRMIKQFIEGQYDAVRVAYMRFESNTRQAPEVLQLLPMEAASSDSAQEEQTLHAEYDFNPSATQLLKDLLPMVVKTTLFQIFNDAVTSEQIMRMVAMKAATENAKGLGQTLRRDFNRARQSQITTELSEIISGATALE